MLCEVRTCKYASITINELMVLNHHNDDAGNRGSYGRQYSNFQDQLTIA